MPDGKKQSILIVDEDRATRDAVKACLEGTEFSWWEAGGYEEAVEFAKRVQDIAIDFLVVDARLPPGNGADLARDVLGYRPDLKTLFLADPFGLAFEEELRGYPCDSLSKPVGKAELLDRLRGLFLSGEEFRSPGHRMGVGS